MSLNLFSEFGQVSMFITLWKRKREYYWCKYTYGGSGRVDWEKQRQLQSWISFCDCKWTLLSPCFGRASAWSRVSVDFIKGKELIINWCHQMAAYTNNPQKSSGVISQGVCKTDPGEGLPSPCSTYWLREHLALGNRWLALTIVETYKGRDSVFPLLYIQVPRKVPGTLQGNQNICWMEAAKKNSLPIILFMSIFFKDMTFINRGRSIVNHEISKMWYNFTLPIICAQWQLYQLLLLKVKYGCSKKPMFSPSVFVVSPCLPKNVYNVKNR